MWHIYYFICITLASLCPVDHYMISYQIILLFVFTTLTSALKVNKSINVNAYWLPKEQNPLNMVNI